VAAHASGSGTIDFAKNAMQLNISTTADGHQNRADVLYLGQTIYENIPGISQLEPGKSWISIDLSQSRQSAGQNVVGSIGDGENPAAMLRLLSEQGNTVTALGSSRVDGVAVQGYSVSINESALRSDLKSSDIPAWMRQAVSAVDLGTTNYTLCTDNHGLLRRVTVAMAPRPVRLLCGRLIASMSGCASNENSSRVIGLIL
jgi:hypothetical protein